MQRDFCLYCGALLSGRACTCTLTADLQSELERRERVHLTEFNQASPLTMRDMTERVRTERGAVTVSELLSAVNYPHAIRELGVRRTERELIQLVYEKAHGSRLYRWRLD